MEFPTAEQSLDRDDEQHPQNVQTKEIGYPKENGFEDLVDHPEIINALDCKSIRNPRPIQIDAIIHLHKYSDVLVRAKGGSGKTLPFFIVILDYYSQRLNIPFGTWCIIFAPTPAICKSMHEELTSFISLSSMRLTPRVALITSDTTSHELSHYFSLAHEIIISTPDQVLEGIQNGNIRPLDGSVFILDEIEKLIDHGYDSALKAIIEHVPMPYQCWASSSPRFDVKGLRSIIKRNPYILTLQEDDSVKSEIIPSNVQQSYIWCKPYEKLVHLKDLICSMNGNVLILTNSVDMCKKVSLFIYMAVRHASLHACFDSGLPDEIHLRKGDGRLRCFVATYEKLIDIVVNIDLVINFDVPLIPGDYIGALGCAGKMGIGELCSLVCEEEEVNFINLKSAVELQLGDSNFIFPEAYGFTPKPCLTQVAKQIIKWDVNEGPFYNHKWN